jgi:hypothetical protein
MSEQRNLGAEVKAQIEAELRKAASLPPSELETVLAPYLQPLREMFQQIHSVRRAWLTWVEENRETFLRVGQAVDEVAAKVGTFLVEMDEASQRFAEMLREVERLADCGWTVPTELTVSELIDFLRSPDAEAAAAYLIQRLDSMDPDWSRTEARLCGDPHLAEFQTVLPQCFRAIRRGDYAIAVPNLIAMLERVIQTLNPESLHASTDVLKTLRAKGVIAENAQEDLFCGAIWLSLLKVVSPLWDNLPLNIRDSAGLSRHGVQHGRTEPPNTKTEVVRLLNTLETALALHDLLRENRDFSINDSNDSKKLQPAVALIRANFFLPRGKHRLADASSEEDSQSQSPRT